jgi:hypothetical protein
VTDLAPPELRFTVACAPAHAHATWAERTSLWRPHGHSLSAERGLTVTFVVPHFEAACVATV